VLIERQARRGDDVFMARTRDFKTVMVPGDASMLGSYVTVEITGTTGSTFTGQIVGERKPLPLAV
jgi:tRNA-2-methylthio-N6-dimethylallyladenosine synthase